MNYYLTPETIAEALELTHIRKSTPTGLFLLSEYDLSPYGIEKAISEGAIELSDNMPGLPGGDVTHDITEQEETAEPVVEHEQTEESLGETQEEEASDAEETLDEQHEESVVDEQEDAPAEDGTAADETEEEVEETNKEK